MRLLFIAEFVTLLILVYVGPFMCMYNHHYVQDAEHPTATESPLC